MKRDELRRERERQMLLNSLEFRCIQKAEKSDSSMGRAIGDDLGALGPRTWLPSVASTALTLSVGPRGNSSERARLPAGGPSASCGRESSHPSLGAQMEEQRLQGSAVGGPRHAGGQGECS